MVALSAILTQISWFKDFNELFVIEHRESLWNPLLNFLTRKLRKGILSFITTLKHKNDTSVEEKQHVVWRKTTRCLKENNTWFERKRHVVYEKTTRCLWENDMSVEVEGGIGEGKEDFKEMISDEEESKSGDFEDSSFSPKVW